MFNNFNNNTIDQQNEITFYKSRYSAFLLFGFIAFQGYVIPVTHLSQNWAIWPNIPDIFALGLIINKIFNNNKQLNLSMFNQKNYIDFFKMWLFFIANFIFVTIPFSESINGIKYGGFSIIIMTKSFLILWAIIDIPIDCKRMKYLNIASLVTFLWLTISTIADKLMLIEIDNFTKHLPRQGSGYWSVKNLVSTVSPNHGGTSVLILIIGAIVLITSYNKDNLQRIIVYLLSIAACFITGSRQGLIRIVVFILLISIKQSKIKFIIALTILLPIFMIMPYKKHTNISENPYISDSLKRNQAILNDPFSNETLGGRPIFWNKVISVLNDKPIRWFIGIGVGNFIDQSRASHNMVLKLLQDGGIIEVIVLFILWFRIFRRTWKINNSAWVQISLVGAMMTSIYTSEIFYPTLATGWYLGLFIITFYLTDKSIKTDYRNI